MNSAGWLVGVLQVSHEFTELAVLLTGLEKTEQSHSQVWDVGAESQMDSLFLLYLNLGADGTWSQKMSLFSSLRFVTITMSLYMTNGIGKS